MELSDVLVEFCECAIHAILKTREVYPHTLFEQRNKYGIFVWQCRHPEICNYIHRVMLNCRSLIAAGAISKVMVVTRNSITNIVIDVISIILSGYMGNNSNNNNSKMSYQLSDIQLLQEEFRSVILKIGILDSQLEKYNNAGK